MILWNVSEEPQPALQKQRSHYYIEYRVRVCCFQAITCSSTLHSTQKSDDHHQPKHKSTFCPEPEIIVATLLMCVQYLHLLSVSYFCTGCCCGPACSPPALGYYLLDGCIDGWSGVANMKSFSAPPHENINNNLLPTICNTGISAGPSGWKEEASNKPFQEMKQKTDSHWRAHKSFLVLG